MEDLKKDKIVTIWKEAEWPDTLDLDEVYRLEHQTEQVPPEWDQPEERDLETLEKSLGASAESRMRWQELEAELAFSERLDQEAASIFREEEREETGNNISCEIPAERFIPAPAAGCQMALRVLPAPQKGEQLVQPRPVQSEITGQTPRKKGPTPYEAAQSLISKEVLVVNRAGVYWYDGMIYRLQKRDDLKRLIVSVCRDAVAAAGDARFIDQVYQCLLAEPTICRDDLKPSPHQLVFRDGVLDLRCFKLYNHSPEFFATSFVDASYQRGCVTKCPRFSDFVEQIALGDETLVYRIWEAIGYLLTQDMRGKTFFVLQGPKDSGKTKLGNFIRDCVNRDSVCSLDLHSFGRNFALSSLIGKHLCLDLDLPAGIINERSVSFLKKLTGGDLVATDRKYMEPTEFVNTAKLLFATNHPIAIGTQDDAFFRRLVVLPFRKSVPPEYQDKDLDEKLATERDAVVAKALQYYPGLVSRNYRFSGDFQANIGLSSGEGLMAKITGFLLNDCEEKESVWTPLQELQAVFFLRYGESVAANVFSERIKLLLVTLYPNVIHKRDRIGGRGNPVSGFLGLKVKEESGT